MPEDHHDLVIKTIELKLKELNKVIKETEQVLKQVKTTGNSTKVDNLEQQLYEYMVLKHELESALKRLQPQTDTYGQITSLPELIKFLSTEENRRAEGRRNALCQMAAESERQRLMRPIKFLDNTYDCCLLNSDTMKMLNDEGIEIQDGEENTESQN